LGTLPKVSSNPLHLSQLGDAAGALKTFDAYLVAGGDLSEEAEFGRMSMTRRETCADPSFH